MSILLGIAAALPQGNPVERLVVAASPTPAPSTGSNPLSGLKPDWSVFGSDTTALWQRILKGVWGLALVIAVGYMIHGIAMMAAAKKQHHPGDLREGKKEASVAAIAFGALCCLGVIVGAIVSVAGG